MRDYPGRDPGLPLRATRGVDRRRYLVQRDNQDPAAIGSVISADIAEDKIPAGIGSLGNVARIWPV
jgi:hypothetical protein